MSTNFINRTGAQALMPEEYAREIFQSAIGNSVVMSLARRLPNMSRAQLRMPVLSGLITAGFVNGDTGLKQTSIASWANKYINADELAVIVPIPQAVLDDTDYNLWDEIRPRIGEAIGIAFDQAVLFGTNAPGDWPTSLKAGSVAAGQSISFAAPPAGLTDLYDMVLSDGGINSFIEADGYMVTGYIGAMSMKAKLRGLRDNIGQPIFLRSMSDATTVFELDGSPVRFPITGAMDPAQALLFAAQWDQVVWALRQDLTYNLLDQAVIQDNSGNILYNLAQQDMVALRAVLRVGWQLPNPVTRLNTNDATRYPAAVLLP